MTRQATALAALAAAGLTLAACGGSGSKTQSSSTPAATTAASTSSATVHTARATSLGATILVDSSGMALYRLSGESAGHFICTSTACLAVWHPLRPVAGSAPTGAGSLTAVRRPDGSEQVAYRGEPLYTFVSDTTPGETSGQGLRDVGTWNVIEPAGPAAAPASEPASGGASRY
jgi:predicted lipoprotein with Yx(FWY)xxD motif